MRCFVCKQEFNSDGILLNFDGDFACSTKCETQHEKDIHELGEACQTEAGFLAWMQM